MQLDEHLIADLDDLPDPGAREFRIGASDWPFRGILVRWHGAVTAYANSCPHQGHPLNLEQDRFLDSTGSLLQCASHGALFEPGTGVCAAGPCAGKRLIGLECRVADGRVYVRAPESQRDLARLS